MKTRSPKKRTSFLGLPPDPIQYVFLGQVSVGPVAWDVWAREQSGSEWVTVKVVAPEGVNRKHKANYWLGWHLKEGRWAQGTELATAEKHQPDLLHKVHALLWVREFTKEKTP